MNTKESIKLEDITLLTVVYAALAIASVLSGDWLDVADTPHIKRLVIIKIRSMNHRDVYLGE